MSATGPEPAAGDTRGEGPGPTSPPASGAPAALGAGRLRARFARGKKRPRRRLRERIDLHKAMFVLPNLFTVSSIFCGFYAMTRCLDAPSADDLRRAAVAILIGMFCDMFDGRVARLTRTQSEFGMQLDSLADAIAFGAAPGILLYRWALEDFGFLGLFLSFAYVACGALRLARFNVLAMRDPSAGGGNFFVGLPIPLAAGTVIAAVLATYPFERAEGGGLVIELQPGGSGLVMAPWLALVGTALVALLMVSSVRYRTFKKVKMKPATIAVVLGVLTGFVIVALATRAVLALAFLFALYIALGLFESGARLALGQPSPEGQASVLPPAPTPKPPEAKPT
jgi:CDP-diacylglycerol--serine O-phosphatidyltransferase